MNPLHVKVYAPASISNVGPGFDVLGIAIDAPGDYVTAARSPRPGVWFRLRGNGEVPEDPSENVAAYVAGLMLREFAPPFGIDLTLDKRMPVGSGLGSSGASSVAAAAAVNALLPRPLPKEELLQFAMEGERRASGAAHADNVAPSLFGGVCLIRSYHPLDVVRLPAMRSAVWVVVHPDFVMRTREMREALPSRIPLTTAVRQWGNLGGVVAGIMNDDARLVGRSIEDVVAEPVRSRFIPGYAEVVRAALDAGAFGCSISGSGPSLFALTDGMPRAKKIAAAMSRAFRRAGRVRCEAFISRTNPDGAVVRKRSKR